MCTKEWIWSHQMAIQNRTVSRFYTEKPGEKNIIKKDFKQILIFFTLKKFTFKKNPELFYLTLSWIFTPKLKYGNKFWTFCYKVKKFRIFTYIPSIYSPTGKMIELHWAKQFNSNQILLTTVEVIVILK